MVNCTIGGGSMTRRSRSPNPQLRAADGCCRTIMRYSDGGACTADGIGCLEPLLLSELRRFEMLMDLASCLGEALDCVLGGLCGNGAMDRPLCPGW